MPSPASRPVIGITCDIHYRDNRGVKTRRDLLQHYYSQAVLKAGGLPVIIPANAPELCEPYLDLVHGMVFSGGDNDVDPALYGETPHEKLGRIDRERLNFEWPLLRLCEARRLPTLGVCGGMQLMNVMRGGSLYQDLPSQRPSRLQHSQTHDKREAAHTVSFCDERFAAWYRATETAVNSTHHQAVKALGQRLTVTAQDEESLVEAFMDSNLPFFVGVQWHPEALSHEHGLVPYVRLVEAAAAFRARG